MSGPLTGYRIIELAGIGPAPFAAMMLADMGAEVVRVDRTQAVQMPEPDTPATNLMLRGRRSIAIDLKHPDGATTLLDLVGHADALIEGFRPGVMERLGVGPEQCRIRNPKLVFGRMTGWGQEGPYAQAAGHDINYISLAGSLAHIGRAGESPVPPLNLVGDYGGGGMFLAYGVVCGLLEAGRSGEGQVIDVAMVDGVTALMTTFWSAAQSGAFDENARGTNLLDTGAHFYDVYRCADGEYVSIGSIEPQFYAELMRLTGLDGDEEFAGQMDASRWSSLKTRLDGVFAGRTRAEWCALMEHTDVCFAPVLTMSEAAEHPHNVARSTIVDIGGARQPAPAPRFSRTIPQITRPPSHPGQHTREVLVDWGLPEDRIDALIKNRAVVTA
jgi:alpha-methylacyl-CoA racemase